jgi:hypothetical protein
MSIQKKSLISSLNATKKAIVASTPAADAPEAPKVAKAATRLALRGPAGSPMTRYSTKLTRR